MINKDNKLKDLLKYYTKKELLDAVLIDLIFFFLTGGTMIIIFVNIIFMAVRFFTPFYFALYTLLILFNYIGKKYFIETLKNYKTVSNLDYKQIRLMMTIVYSIIILITQIIIFILIN